MSKLDFILAQRKGRTPTSDPSGPPAPVEWQEIRRIIGLPMVLPFDGPEIEEFNRTHVLADAFEEGWRLWAVQCEAIAAYKQYGGLFAPIGVGWGKTLITQAIAHAAYSAGMQKVMILIPSSVLHQLVSIQFPLARKKIPISYPVLIMGGKSSAQRRALAHSGKKGLYIMPYSCLSLKDTEECLNAIAPELIICDEADHLGNRKSARTKRILNYVEKHKPQGCVLSGTITRNSISDYAHLIKWCLGRNSPLPLSGHLADEWGSRIDAQAVMSDATGPIVPLVDWARDRFPNQDITEDTAGFRRAFKLRLKTAPGVVATGDVEIGPSLIVNNLPVTNPDTAPGWEELERLRKQVVDAWLTPNGDEIEHAIHTYKWLYELSAGFYNELTFPTAELFAEREQVGLGAATLILEHARVMHGAQQEFHSTLRGWIDSNGRSGLDTPLLVRSSMAQHGPKHTGVDLYGSWGQWRRLRGGLADLLRASKAGGIAERDLQLRLGRCLRDKRVVRVCPYKINHAVIWAKRLGKKNPAAIIWVKNIGVGHWVHEELQANGIDSLYCPAGNVGNKRILEKASESRVVVASMKAHGTGKNLQAFNQQLFLQWPRDAKLAEQTLGRMHRNGQEASEVWAHTNFTTEFDELCMAATLNDSLYIHQTTGNRQKLIYCTYPTLPRVFPSSVLRERGFQNRELTAEAKRTLVERFGQEIEGTA